MCSKIDSSDDSKEDRIMTTFPAEKYLTKNIDQSYNCV